MTAPDTWSIVESAFDVASNRHFEGLFTLGSGPLQQRGALEEGLHREPQDREFLRIMGNVSVEEPPAFRSRVGTYMPGVTGPHPTCNDQLINLPAVHGLKIYTAGERLDMQRCRIRDYRRWLDLRTARLHRSFVWQTPVGAELRVRFERFISAQRRHVMALRCEIAHVAGPPSELRFLGMLSAEVRTNGFDHFESVEITGEHEPITMTVRTNGGDLVAAAALLTCDRGLPWSVEVEPRWVALAASALLEPGQTLRVDKFAAMISSRHVGRTPLDAARRLAWDAAAAGFERLGQEHDAVWAARWQATDVEIEGDPESQRGLRASLYHLLRAVVEDDPRCGMDARAASGEAYCGRSFWDTEIFMLPVLLYTRPEVGRTLARYRIVTLPGARQNASAAGYAGARYAWESSRTGVECCPLWQFADHEVHITADVAYGLFHAHLCNEADPGLLRDVAEVLVETARYWVQRVTHDPALDQYELIGVVGPDEYTLLGRNNAYTNRLAAFALTAAHFAWRKLERQDPAAATALRGTLALRDEELSGFVEVAAKLKLPYDESRGLVLQSDDFFSLETFDFARDWPDRGRPLAAVVRQERLLRSQVLKQADVIQLVALFPHEFDVRQMRVAYDTYAPLTSHDSSLSHAVHALVAARCGRDAAALAHWNASVQLDLQPPHASEGVHAACGGGNWQAVVLGFAGLRSRMQSEVLDLDPRLPAAWTRLRFPFVWTGQPLRFELTPGHAAISHGGTRPIRAVIRGAPYTLEPGHTYEFELVAGRPA